MWHLSFFVALTIFFGNSLQTNTLFCGSQSESLLSRDLAILFSDWVYFSVGAVNHHRAAEESLSPGFAGYVFWFQFPQFQAGECPVVPAPRTGQFYFLFSFFNIWFELDVKDKYFRKKFTNDLEIYFEINYYRLVSGKVINRTKMAWISRTLFGQDKVMCLPKEFRKNSIWQWDF